MRLTDPWVNKRVDTNFPSVFFFDFENIIFSCNKDVHWLKMLKEHELSAVALQPSTDKNGIQNEYDIYRKGEIKRKIWIKAK